MIVVRVRKTGWSSKENFRVEKLPVTIGRDPKSEVWIDHPQISATHARIELRDDGNLVVNDLKSRNGIKMGWRKRKEIVFRERCEFRAGEVRIEVVSHIGRVEHTQEIELRGMGGLMDWGVGIGCCALSGALQALVRSGPSLLDAIGEFLVVVLIVAVASLGVAFWTKLQLGRYGYPKAFRICAQLALTVTAFHLGQSTLFFNWPWHEWARTLANVLIASLVGYIALRIGWLVFRDEHRHRVTWVVGCIGLFVISLFIIDMQIGDHGNELDFFTPVGVPLTNYGVTDMKHLESSFHKSVTKLEAQRGEQLNGVRNRKMLEAETAKRANANEQKEEAKP